MIKPFVLHTRFLKRNINVCKSSENPPNDGICFSKRKGWTIGFKDNKNASEHLIGFPNGSSIESTV